MKSVKGDDLYNILLKVSFNLNDPYYDDHGNSPYRDGLTLLRTSFYEPFLKENFSDENYDQYVAYYKTTKSYQKNNTIPDKNDVYAKNILMTFLNNENIALNPSLALHRIEYYHDNYLNESIHNVIVVSKREFAECYLAIQNFCIALNPSFVIDDEHLFRTQKEISDFISAKKKKYKRPYDLSLILIASVIISILFLGWVLGIFNNNLRNESNRKGVGGPVNQKAILDSAKKELSKPQTAIQGEKDWGKNRPVIKQAPIHVFIPSKDTGNTNKPTQSSGAIHIKENNGIANTGTIGSVRIVTKDTGK